jgi:hypothetical protein
VRAHRFGKDGGGVWHILGVDNVGVKDEGQGPAMIAAGAPTFEATRGLEWAVLRDESPPPTDRGIIAPPRQIVHRAVDE